MKRRQAKHRRPQPEPLRGGPFPLMRTPVAQLLLNPNAPSAEVPPELAERDYEFPQVQLPASRPLVDHTQLMAALEDDDTQPIDLADMVVDETPQPARHEGLAPIPVPSPPFLNAHPPRPEPSAPWLHVGNALPARLTDLELTVLDAPVPQDAPPAPSLPARLRRDKAHPFRFDAFDSEFWELVETTARQRQAGPGGLQMSTDSAMNALDGRLAAVDRAHREAVERDTGMEYAAWLASLVAEAGRPALPHRVPGESLPEIEASRSELVTR